MRTKAMRLIHAALAGIASLVLANSVAAQTTVEYYHTDAIGSVRVVTDAAGNLLRQHDYWPFGAEVNPPPGECTDVKDPRGFTGQERDKETCQDYFGGRYYRSGTVAGAPPRASGRFTSPDPVLDIDAAIADPQRWNRYAYVSNNPLGLIDPDGREIVAVNPRTGMFYGGGPEALRAARAPQGVGSVVGLAGMFVGGVFGGVGLQLAKTCYLSPFCQVAVIGAAEGAAGGAPTGYNLRVGQPLLNQFNSVDSLLGQLGNVDVLKNGAKQAFVTGDGSAIFNAISAGGTALAGGRVRLPDGTILGRHFSTATGVFTIDVNRAGELYKIRIVPPA